MLSCSKKLATSVGSKPFFTRENSLFLISFGVKGICYPP
ncbi:hypothetical protein CSC52_1845 [Staphylococcus aureus]|nr:hypothetical protein CSC52_1845 [Staphylococcus aureus]